MTPFCCTANSEVPRKEPVTVTDSAEPHSQPPLPISPALKIPLFPPATMSIMAVIPWECESHFIV